MCQKKIFNFKSKKSYFLLLAFESLIIKLEYKLLIDVSRKLSS